MRKVQIRPATKIDRSEVLALCQAMMAEVLGEEHVGALLPALADETRSSFESDGEDIFFVAQEQDALIGCGRVVIFPYHPLFRFLPRTSHAYIELMYTVPSFRGRGIGARIVQALEGWAAGRGIRNITLHAAPDAQKFYAHAGYEDMREMSRRLSG